MRNVIWVLSFILIHTTQAAEVPFPPLQGKFSVGVREAQFTQVGRPELLFPENPGACDLRNSLKSRIFPVTIYYPSNSKAGVPEDYLPQSLVSAYRVPPSIATLKKRSVLNAEISRTQRSYPVVVFSPGFSIPAQFYSAILEEIASHGWIVVAISHPYISGYVELPEFGCAATSAELPSTRQDVLKMLRTSVLEMSRDFDFVLESVTRKRQAGESIYRSMDLDRISWMGHSIGGMSSTIYCSKAGSRCRAAINLDGGDYSGEETEALGAWPTRKDLPYLAIRSESFSHLKKIPIEVQGANQTLVDVHRIDHQTFNDKIFLATLVPPLFPPRPSRANPDGTLDSLPWLASEDSHSIIIGHILAVLGSADKPVWPRFDGRVSSYFARRSGR
jgi:hypothetical protein